MTDIQSQLDSTRLRAYRAEEELTALRQLLDENPEKIPHAATWLQMKNARQRVQLRTLVRRVVAQRAVLRRLSETGRAPTDEDWAVIRAGLPEECETAELRAGLTPT